MRRIAALLIVLTWNSSQPSGMLAQNGKVPITTRSEEARTRFLEGRVLVERLQPREGRALFHQAIALDSSFAMAEYYLALNAPNAREGAEHLARAVALADRISEGERLVILAQQARVNADPATVVRHLETLVARYPQDERAHWLLGSAYSARQKYPMAIAEYGKAIAINPQFSLAYNSVGYAYRATDSMPQAERAFQRYIALVPDDPNPYDSYAEFLMKTGRFDESIAQYRKALAIDPRFGASHIGISANQVFAGRHAAAIAEAQVYYDGARDDTERRLALLSQVLAAVDQGATDQALEFMQASFDLARAAGDTVSMAADLVAMGDIMLGAERVDSARIRYRSAYDLVAASSLSADIREDNALAWHYNRARVALAGHDLATAKSEAAAYLAGAEARHNDVRIRQAHEMNGFIALHDRQSDQALAEFALGNPQSPEIQYAIAEAWRAKGDTARADRLAAEAVNQYILPTLPYMLIRAKARPVATR